MASAQELGATHGISPKQIMKRDPELVREILLAVEALPPARHSRSIVIGGDWPDEVKADHLILLKDAGFIEGNIKRIGGSMLVAISGLTWEGHDFLDNAKNETVWKTTQEKIKKLGGSISFEVMKAMLSVTAKDLMGG